MRPWIATRNACSELLAMLSQRLYRQPLLDTQLKL